MSYIPLQSQEYSDNAARGPAPLADDKFDEGLQSKDTKPNWTSLLLSFSTIVSALAVLVVSPTRDVPTTRSLVGLRHPPRTPQSEDIFALNHLEYAPKIQFPRAMVRVNEQEPSRTYGHSSHIVISSKDSMIYQWRTLPSKFPGCYIAAAMPDDPAIAAAKNKTFTSSGPLDAFKVWKIPNLTDEQLQSLSWSTKPQERELLGQVAFYNDADMVKVLGREDAWQLEPPTPRFRCREGGTFTFEISCEGCRIEFDQLFSMPPLAFDLFQLA